MIILHTPAPTSLLSLLIGNAAEIIEGRTPTGEPDCFYGWLERQHEGCLPNNEVHSENVEVLREIAATVKRAGYQVVVTAPDADGNDSVLAGLPLVYDWHHSH